MKPSSFCFTSAPDHPTSNGELRHCRRLSRRTSLAAKTTIATKNLHLTDSMAPPGRLSLQSHTAAAFSPSKKKSSKRKKKKLSANARTPPLPPPSTSHAPPPPRELAANGRSLQVGLGESSARAARRAAEGGRWASWGSGAPERRWRRRSLAAAPRLRLDEGCSNPGGGFFFYGVLWAE